MKKFTFLFALCAMLFLNVGIAKAETATISYAGETTNMTGNNDATLVGLDASLWSVVSDKGSANNHVGLNKAGNIRLYAHKDSGNGNILTVSISQGTIEKITLDILQEATYEVKVAGNIVAATEETTYSIGATSFSIQNITSGASTQLQLNSITITYSSTGEGGTTPEEPETPTLPEGAITCAEAAVIAAADGYVGTEDVTVYGYVVELGNAKADGSKQCFYMSDTKGGAKQFMAYWAFVPQLFVVGDYVTVTGPLKNYQGTIEIVDGQAVLLSASTTPEEPEEPIEPETPEAKPLTDGYTKVTDISALAKGDKVVLYCDEYAVGVAGFDGTKSGVMAETDWVEYAVELVDGGMKLKDEVAGKYAALPEKNSFKYNDAGSVFTVTENALLAAFLESENNTFFLYYNTNNGNNPLCRMYIDKSTDERYAPFYVYKVANSTAVEDVTIGESAVKVMHNGQVLIKRGENVYNVVGVQVK